MGDVQAARARFAVNILFFVNGALISNVFPRLPAIKAALGLSNAELGAAVGAASFGALLAGPLAGAAAARFGSGRLAVTTGAFYGLALPLLGVAGGWPALAAAFMLLGVLDVLMDVAMNAHGLQVQGHYPRSIFNAFHAWWSLGATAGGLVGTGAAALGVPIPVHLLVVGALVAVAVVIAGRWLLHEPQPAASGAEGVAAAPVSRLRLLGALAPLAALSVAAAFVEDVPGSFGGIYMRDWLGTSAGVAGLAWVGFVGGMTAGRLLADRVVDTYGTKAVVRAGNACAATGLAIALLLNQPAAAVAGFTAVGLGASATIPTLFVFAGRRTDRPADGIALVSWATRAGFLASPVIVGSIADAAGLPFGVALCAVAAALIAVAVPRR
jgi:MFS family permease